MLIQILIATILINNLALAADEVLPLSKGQSAPYSGLLFPTKKAEEIRFRLIDADLTKKTNESLVRSLDTAHKINLINEERLATYSAQLDRDVQNLGRAQSFSDVEKLLWFAAGAGLTVLIYHVTR